MGVSIQDEPRLTTTEAIEKKANHRATIVLITAGIRRPHPDPETTDLELIDIPDTGFQVVTRKGQFSNGDYGVYIQPDSVVPQTAPFKFIWEQYVTPGEIDALQLVPEKRRRITVRRFRGQYSEGLLLPVVDFPELLDEHGNLGIALSDYGRAAARLQVGDDVSDILNITHYDPDADKGVSTRADQGHSPKRKFKYPRTLRGWFGFVTRIFRSRGRIAEATEDVPFSVPTYDVEGFKNYKNTFVPGEEVVLREKIHGSNARFLFLEGKQYAGSRNQWKAPGSNSLWHRALADNEWIEAWCREHEGYALYGEITPTQKAFTYGAKLDKNGSPTKIRFFAFDVLDPTGEWWDYRKFSFDLTAGQVTEAEVVPHLYIGPYYDGLLEKFVDGPSFVHGAGHIREGVVAKTTTERTQRGLGRTQLKLVSNKFLEKDSK
jgi:hypothetical protein